MGAPAWINKAACAGMDPAIFFPVPITAHAMVRARAICFDCPVREQCKQYAQAIGASDGIWGGKERVPWYAKSDRARFQTSRADQEVKPCGTEAAYWRHKRHREAPCRACIFAAAEASNNRRRQRLGRGR